MSRAIPIIDFSAFVHDTGDDRRYVATQVDQALSTVGFLRLRNHGIEQSKIDSCFQWSQRLFAFSEAEKQALVPASPRSHGFLCTKGEIIRDRASLKESFSCGSPADNVRPNHWPREDLLPGFRECMEDLFKDCGDLALLLFECLSIALDLPDEETLAQYHSKRTYDLGLHHYPKIPASQHRANGRLVRLPAHSDIGTFTLLFQDDTGGLEIADMSTTNSTASAAVEQECDFIHVDYEPNTIIMNVGYLLMRWSNGRWKNTVHRVSEPPAFVLSNGYHDPASSTEISVPERFSIGYFCTPDPETVIEPFTCCCTEADLPKKRLNVGKWLRRKEEKMYAKP